MKAARPAPGWGGGGRVGAWLAALVLTALVAYHSTFQAELVFDDRGSILENPTIRRLWPPAEMLSPPIHGLPVTGRPLTNVSLAINYALHGTDVRGYHVVNLAVHLLCAFTLFGLVRRALVQARWVAQPGDASAIAGATALLWVAHPLMTAGVTYVSQRAEALGSLFVLLALYAWLRSLESTRPRTWLGAAVAACWLGVGAKEFSAAIPVLVAVHDRLFVAGSWREVWRRRGLFHAALVASWLPLAWLILGTQNRGGTWAGDSGFTPWEYTLLQCRALVHYLRLVVWPVSLVFDYGRNLPQPAWTGVLPQAAVIAALLGAVGYGLARRSLAAFAALAALGVLAPTSSFVPIADAMFEHRMYLPAAAVIVVAVGWTYRRFGHRMWWGVGPLVLVLTAGSVARNADYRTAVGLWSDTVRKMPANARAQGNLGAELSRVFRHAEAVPHLEEAWRLQPGVPEVAHDLAVALDFTGRRGEAIGMYREALRLAPDSVLTQLNLANALAETGAQAESIGWYTRAVTAAPQFAPAHTGLARQLLRAGRIDEALEHYREAAQLSPTDAEAYFNLGDALAQARRLPEAITALREAVRLRPDYPAALTNLGNALLLSQRTDEAAAAFRESLRFAPDPRTHTNLGYALVLMGKPAEARGQFEAALRLDPGYRPARDGLVRLGPAP